MSDWLIDRDMMSPQQRELLSKQKLDKCLYITGPAGSGKTIMALYLAQRLHITKPDSSVRLLVFTNILCQFISAGMEQLGVPTSFVTNAYQWYRREGSPSYDYFLIDEAQDFCFTKEQAQAANFHSGSIMEIHNKTRKGMLLFGDMKQRIYSGREWSEEDLRTLCHKCKRSEACQRSSGGGARLIGSFDYRILPQNFRMPKKIAQIAASFLSSFDGDELIRTCMNDDASSRAMAIRCSSLLEKAKCISAIIQNNGLTDVGILVGTSYQGSLILNALWQQKVYCEAYLARSRSSYPAIDFGTTNPKIMTYHTAKGLQFHTVILPFGEYKPDEIRALFVAITRAKKQIFILFEGTLCASLNQIPAKLLLRKKWGG